MEPGQHAGPPVVPGWCARQMTVCLQLHHDFPVDASQNVHNCPAAQLQLGKRALLAVVVLVLTAAFGGRLS